MMAPPSPPDSHPVIPEAEPLHALFNYIRRQTGFTVSLHDAYGIFSSIPELLLPFPLRIHRSPVCKIVKSTKHGMSACLENKMKVVDVVHRRQKSLCGMCHLGLTERVEPIVFNSHCVASLFYGPFVIRETKRESLRRLRLYCEQTQGDFPALKEALDKIPVISQKQLPQIAQDVRTCATIVQGLLQAWNPPLEEFVRTNSLPMFSSEKPFIVQQVTAIIHREAGEPWNVQSLAAELKCHPNYLGSMFQKHMGCKLTTYLREARIHRAKMILRSGRFNITEVALMCGFEGISQFNRAFHATAGMSPREYLKQPHTKEA